MNLPIKKQIDYALGLASGQDDPHSITITELCASLSRLHAELDDARDHAYGWHNQCQTVATILGLPEPEGIGHAEAVRDKFEEIRAENERLTSQRDEAVKNAEIVCNSYADENQRLHDRALSAEAREAKGVEDMRERAAKAIESHPDSVLIAHLQKIIRALSTEVQNG